MGQLFKLNWVAPVLALLNVEDVALRVWAVIMFEGETGEGVGGEDFAVQLENLPHSPVITSHNKHTAAKSMPVS